MELWIRSQNKGALIKVEILGHTDGTIHSYSGISKTELGTYKSDERALEVLDEIHQRLLYLQTLEIDASCWKTIKGNINCVYEMPKE